MLFRSISTAVETSEEKCTISSRERSGPRGNIAELRPALSHTTRVTTSSNWSPNTPVSWGFPVLRTESGRSLGSLKQYSMDWNAADTSEVTTKHPVGPSALAQTVYTLKAAVQAVDKAAEVNTLPTLHTIDVHHPQSPRFGLSNCYSAEFRLLGANLR